MKSLSGLFYSTLAFFVFFSTLSVAAAEKETAENSAASGGQKPVLISVFVRQDCQHCLAEKEFLSALREKYGSKITVAYHDLADPREREKFSAVAEKFSLSKGTPITLVGGSVFQGFDRPETTGRMIEALIAAASAETADLDFDRALRESEKVRVLSSLSAGKTCPAGESKRGDSRCAIEEGGITVTVPLWEKKLDLTDYSLPAISFVLGLIDGFNPCALWVLVMFLLLLSQTGSRRRMWQYAGLFILAETLMYYLILTLWLSAWDFIGLSRLVTPAVGLLALGSGVYFLHKWRTWQPVCSVTDKKSQEKISNRLRDLVSRPMTPAVALGILALALSVNIFEFACSIGIPQAFTKILDLNNLSFWSEQLQMGIYMLAYMIDDFVVFGLAIFGIGKLSVTMKYSKYSTLLGGILMLILGLLLIFSPQSLVF